MRKVSRLLRQIFGLTTFLILALALVYVIQWGRNLSIIDNSAGSGTEVNPYPLPSDLDSSLLTSTPYPGPDDIESTQVVQKSPLALATLVPVPPPGWPTNEPWPPDLSKRTPFPTNSYSLFPTPDNSLLKGFDQLPGALTIWFPLFEKGDMNPTLWEARMDTGNKAVEFSPLNFQLEMPAPITGPDPGSIIVNMHLSPDSRWLVADYAYGSSQLIDLQSGKSRNLVVGLPSQYWKFGSWVSSNPVKLTVFGSEIPINNAKMINVETGELEQAALLEQGAIIEDGDLVGITYSPNGNNYAIAVVTPPTAGIRDKWVGEVCLNDCKTKKIAEIEGGASFVDGSLQWSPDQKNLIWAVVVTGDEGKLEAELWIYNFDSEVAKRINILGTSVKNIYPPVWSPDGSKIAVLKTVLSNNGKEEIQNLFLIDVETGEETQLPAFSNNQISHLQWLPDGDWLAFTLSKGDYGEIWITKLDGKTYFPIAGPTLPKAPYILSK